MGRQAMIEPANSQPDVLDHFAMVTQHAEAAKPTGPRGKLVLSSLSAGETRIAARTTSLKFVLDGEEEYEVDGRRVYVNRGQFLMVDPGADCVARIRRRDSNRGMCIYLPIDGVEGHLSAGRTLVLSAGNDPLGAFMTNQATRLWRDPEVAATVVDAVIAAAARLTNVARLQAEARMARLGAAKPATRRDLLERLERARSYLEANPHRAVSQGELARAAGLSQFHLARQFRDMFGDSPGAYHRRIRLATAGELIDQGSTLEAAATRTGYSDGSALGHALRRLRG